MKKNFLCHQYKLLSSSQMVVFRELKASLAHILSIYNHFAPIQAYAVIIDANHILAQRLLNMM